MEKIENLPIDGNPAQDENVVDSIRILQEKINELIDMIETMYSRLRMRGSL